MNERDQRAFGSSARFLVHEADAFRFQHRERRPKILDAQRDVVQAGSAPLDVLGDRRVRGGGFEQFERRFANRNEMRAHALRPNLLRRIDVQTKGVAIERERLLDITDRDTDVIEASLQLCAFVLTSVRPRSSAAAEYGSSVRAAMRDNMASNSPGASTSRSR